MRNRKAAPGAKAAIAEEVGGADSYPFPGHDSLGLLLRVAMSGLRKAFKEQLAERDIPWSMWYYLRVLWENDGLSQKELIAKVGMLQPNAVSSIKAMQERNFVTVERDETDLRRTCIRLTPEGRELETLLLPKVRDRVEGVAFRDFDERERETLIALLARVCGNVTRSDDA
jgi:MarR family transcriptional regulator, organic hydroperoxide resistance regulator